MRTAPILLIVLLAPVALASQARFTSRVDSVRVDVLVTSGGVPVTGLSADDFVVRDNGAIQQVTLLESGALPLDVTVALDMSSSLEADQLAALRRGCGLLLDNLRTEDRAGLLAFSQTVFQPQPLTGEIPLVRRALLDRVPRGGTALADAMYTGITLSDAAGRRPLLIVFSDGLDTASWLTASDVVDAARRFETVVYAASTMSRQQTPEMLRDVTAQTGGQLLQVTSRDLESAFARILDEFRQRYVLSYTLPGTPAPGWHRIDVRMKQRGMSVRARAGYLVGPPPRPRRSP